MELVEKVSDILARKPSDLWSLPPEATVYEAVAMMAERHVGALLVIDGARLVGIVSERDYARKIILQGRASRQTTVAEIMTSPVITASPDDSLEHCMTLMTERRFRHLPVVKDGAILGVLSTGDIIKFILSKQEAEIRQLHAYIAGGYPG